MLELQTAQQNAVSGHLEYYKLHGLNPVKYDMTNRAWHFQRRASLYRSLGIHAVTIRHARVLEVAVGTGQNSLYLASQRPRHFTLVEPNPVAIREIKQLYSQPEYASWRPELFEGTLQEFTATEPYDVVVCENWLGSKPGERLLLRKLGSLTAPGGIIAVTVVSPIGFLPNVLRRLLAIRLGCWERSFENATALLVEAFSPHLSTIAAMTRSCTDWVQDNLLNPHYFNISVTLPMVLEDLGDRFSVIGSSPDFAVDWRWFKALYGDSRRFNEHFLAEYHTSCHNFLDYRQVLPRGDLTRNFEAERTALALVHAAGELDQNARSGSGCPAEAHAPILAQLRTFLGCLPTDSSEQGAALREFEQMYSQPHIELDHVRNMKHFGGLFGRETLYVSLEQTTDF